MSARTKQLERSRRFRRLHGEKKAVSPVVATLILILIAVAAAAALYLWLVAWQGGVTKGIGSPTAQYTVTIGGSTSVYPFSEVAINYFEQNNSDVVVSDNQGGTGAGMIAVCTGQVDIGASSTAQTAAGLQSSDGCPTTTSIQIVAYDAVDVIVPVANNHGLQSISWDTLTAIYDGTSTAPTLLAPSIDLNPIGTAPFNVAPWSTHVALAWDQIPAYVGGVSFAVGGMYKAGPTASTAAETESIDSAGVAAAGVACSTSSAGPYTDICDTTFFGGAATGTPCGMYVCAGGTATDLATNAIQTVSRSDASGTTQTFEARLLDATSATAFATTFTGIGFGGCGSNNLISDCGMSSTLTGNGNPGVITAVAGAPDSIGYASDGLARLSTSGVTCEGVASNGCGVGLESVGQTAAVQPSLGSSGSIAIGTILGGFGPTGQTTTKTVASAYGGARPFEYVTTNAPTGEVQRYINFVMQPGTNIAIASASYEVSYYSV